MTVRNFVAEDEQDILQKNFTFGTNHFTEHIYHCMESNHGEMGFENFFITVLVYQ